jgi:pyruvate formate lyase activating enzyme
LCVEACPSTALELLGEAWSLEDLVQEVLKDRVYFEKSNGGVTISGGEPTIQADFAAEFLKQIRAKGIQTALDTCGLCNSKALDTLLPHANLVLFDLKEIDPQKHLTFTGSDNRVILENLIHVAEYIDAHLYPEGLWIRTPLIPGATDTDTNINGIGAWIKTHLDQKVKKWELCAFNNLCRDKYARLGLTWQFEDAELLEENHIQHLVSVAKNSGVDPDIVDWSGTTRLPDTETEAAPAKNALKVVT